MFKDHLVLNLQVLSHSRLTGALEHGISDRDIDIGQPDRVKIDSFIRRVLAHIWPRSLAQISLHECHRR